MSKADEMKGRMGLVDYPLPPPPRTPPDIPDHTLIRRIGAGSYGEVWLACNVVGSYRAVKVVYRESFRDERPYQREFEGIQKFEPISRSSEGFVHVLQIGRNDATGCFYYVMELADDVTEDRGWSEDPSARNERSARAANTDSTTSRGSRFARDSIPTGPCGALQCVVSGGRRLFTAAAVPLALESTPNWSDTARQCLTTLTTTRTIPMPP
jgi:hypothetical protein